MQRPGGVAPRWRRRRRTGAEGTLAPSVDAITGKSSGSSEARPAYRSRGRRDNPSHPQSRHRPNPFRRGARGRADHRPAVARFGIAVAAGRVVPAGTIGEGTGTGTPFAAAGEIALALRREPIRA